jgi:hypothetical protein
LLGCRQTTSSGIVCEAGALDVTRFLTGANNAGSNACCADIVGHAGSRVVVALRIEDVLSEVCVLVTGANSVLGGCSAISGGRSATCLGVVIHDIFVLLMARRAVEKTY